MKPSFRPLRATATPYAGPAPLREHSKVAVASHAAGVGVPNIAKAIEEYVPSEQRTSLADYQAYLDTLFPVVGNPFPTHLYPEAAL